MQQVAVKSWGNSLGIRLPKAVLSKLGITESDEMELSVQGDTIVLKKTFKHKTFEQRLAEYDNKLEVTKFNWGEPKGREIL